jgi:hypothetical protein
MIKAPRTVSAQDTVMAALADAGAGRGRSAQWGGDGSIGGRCSAALEAVVVKEKVHFA